MTGEMICPACRDKMAEITNNRYGILWRCEHCGTIVFIPYEMKEFLEGFKASFKEFKDERRKSND